MLRNFTRPENLIRLRQATLQWGLVSAGLFVEKVVSALILILLARKLSPIEYSQYLSIYSLITFTIVLPSYGLDIWLLTRGKTNQSEVLGEWWSATKVRGVLISAWWILMGCIGFLLDENTFPHIVYWLTLFGLGFETFIMLGYSALRNLNNHSRITIYQTITSGILLITSFVLLLSASSLNLFSLNRTALSLIMLIVVVTHLMIKVRSEIQPVSLSIQYIIRNAKTFLLADFASSIYIRADIAFLSLIKGASAVAIYGPAINILQFTYLIPRALFFYITPKLSAAYNKNKQHYYQLGKIQFLIQSTIGIFLSALIFLFAKHLIVIIFRENFISSIPVLKTLSLIPFFRSIIFAFASILASSGKQEKRTRIQMVMALLNVIALSLGVPLFGVYGLAIIYVVSEFLLMIGYAYLIYRDRQDFFYSAE